MPIGVYKHKSGWCHSEETKEKIRIANTGNIPTEETVKKMSNAKKKNPTRYWLGKKRPSLSEETKEKMSKAHISKGTKPPVRYGKDNNKWKGGVSKAYKTGYGTKRYNDWRRDVFIRDEFTCQDCGIKQVYITAHHINSWANYPDLRFDINNGKTLCEECHEKTDNYKGRNKKGGTK